MKSLNVKKIAAVAAGAVMVGAAAVGAAVSADVAGLSAYKWFTASGTPDFKIVVGANANPWDAVGAGNIAAEAGNLAYAEGPVTITGQEGVTCGGGACNVSSKSVTLTLTTPGINPNILFEMRTHEGNLLDNTPLNRIDNNGVSTSGYTNPGGGNLAVARKISGDDTQLLFKGTITDTTAGKSYTEESFMNLTGSSYYDTISKSVVSGSMFANYRLTFTDPIPACTYDANASNCNGIGAGMLLPTDWKQNDYATPKHRFKIWFLGEQWVIADMTFLGVGTPGGGTLQTVVLGKEILYNPILRVLGNITDPNTGVTIQLADISGFGYGGSNVPRASFKFFDKNGVFLEQFTLDEASNNEVNKYGVTLHVNRVFPGAFQKEAYADVSLYAQKLTLTNGVQVDTTDNQYWTAYLMNGSSGYSIKEIELRLQTQLQTTFLPGDFLPIIAKPANWRLTYQGLDKAVSYDQLTVSTPGNPQVIAVGNSTNYTLLGGLVPIQTSRGSTFDFGAGTITSKLIYFKMNSTDPGFANSNTSTPAGYTGSWWFYRTSDSASFWTATTTAPTYFTNSDENPAPFAAVAAGAANGTLNISENIAKPGTTSSPIWKNWTITFALNKSLGQQITNNEPNNDKAKYNGTDIDVGTVTDRGSRLLGASAAQVAISYPQKVVEAIFDLGLSSVNVSAANTQDQVLREGQTFDMGNGYGVRVKSIDCTTVGGGGAGGVSGLENLKATGAVVVSLDPANTPLVLTDAEAGGVQKAVLVGGPLANTLASAVVPSTNAADWPNPIIKVSGDKILVAGWSAADTQEAVRELLKWLHDNRDAVRTSGTR